MIRSIVEAATGIETGVATGGGVGAGAAAVAVNDDAAGFEVAGGLTLPGVPALPPDPDGVLEDDDGAPPRFVSNVARR